uniref:Uncharacterized protein n=1 Tax=Romanomermis culicivorax TaxID=13658 RepID=A0A915HY60_ROMCU
MEDPGRRRCWERDIDRTKNTEYTVKITMKIILNVYNLDDNVVGGGNSCVLTSLLYKIRCNTTAQSANHDEELKKRHYMKP